MPRAAQAGTSHIWTTLSRGDRDFDADINKRSVVRARDHLQGPKSLHNKVGTVVNITRPYYTERIDGMIGAFEETAEGVQEAPPMLPVNVADMKIRPRYYTAALVLSRNRVEDDGLGLIQKLVPKITERGFERIEMDFQAMLFANPTVYDPLRDQRDGVALASTAHPVGVAGATWGNMAAVPAALDESSLKQAVTSFSNILNEEGDLAPMMPKKFLLLVHPSKVLDAQQLTLSLSSTADYKNSGVINPVSSANGFTFEVFPAFYMPNPQSWMLIAMDTDGDTGLVIVQRKALGAPRKIIRDNPDQVQYFSDMRYAMAVTDPRNVFWNPGT